MRGGPGGARRDASGRGGFTLIEVIGALVVFSVGVLMVVRLSSATGTQMRYAGIRSELTVRAAERLDSLDAEPFSSLVMGADADTLTIAGRAYERSVTLTRLTPLLARVEIALTPVGDEGPTFTTTSYVADTW